MSDFLNKKVLLTAVLFLLLLNASLWYGVFSSLAIDEAEYYFLDVGQGDSQLLVFPDGYGGSMRLLIDGGPGSKVLSSLGKIFGAGDKYIDLVLMTHPQLDHFGGLIDVLKTYKVGAFLGSGKDSGIGAYGALVTELKNQNVPYIVLGAGDSIKYGSATINILSPSPQDLKSKELNDTTLVLLSEHGGIRALFTGDIGFKIESQIMKKYDIGADILKVAHHGSKYSSGNEFLAKVSPDAAVIGVGKNSYGHPTSEAISRLQKAGALIYRTDLDGTIRISL